MGTEEQLLAVGPLDGRYAEKVEPLRLITSEFGLIDRRVQVSVEWIMELGSGILPDIEPLSDNARGALSQLVGQFSIEDAIEIKEIESTNRHDVNAVVRWLKNRLDGDENLSRYTEFVHFGCTSEDINNLAYALIIKDTRDEVLLPNISEILEMVTDKAERYADLAQLSRTHGQPASPTTHGKEWEVYAARLERHRTALGSIGMLGKFNGATGNYSAASFAYPEPEVDWPAAARRLVGVFGLEFNETTTQIEPHDWMARFFSELAHGNNILTDLSTDDWTYIMLNELAQRAAPGEDGSSAMPNKVNPIDFENAEGNFGLASAVLLHLATKLTMSRLQRDLSDSTSQRAIGEAFGHTLVGYANLIRGIGNVYPNEIGIAANLENSWAVLMEPVQAVMRRYGIKGSYDIIKEASRGKAIGQQDYLNLVEGLDIPEDAKARLLNLTPATYTGRAAQIARRLY
jgi:adenylosuccinate lyase